MEKLVDLQLETGGQLLDPQEQALLGQQISQWRICHRNAVDQLERVFQFRDFAEALAFANHVAALAEAHNHHPALLVEWGKATVTWWTHSLGGLHKNDFIMAARCDQLYAG